jgi:hypothetical protein
MNVQDLIYALMEIEDKEKTVVVTFDSLQQTLAETDSIEFVEQMDYINSSDKKTRGNILII